jgi:Glyoxalase-like domain
MISSMIGRMHHVVLDCPDPAALAAFYSALLGLPVTYRDDDWVVVAADDTSSGLAFQRPQVTSHRPGPIPQCHSSSTSTSWSKMPQPQARKCWRSVQPSSTARTSMLTPQAIHSA